ncbi:RNA polymerase sigma factor [Crocinitomicaceae bacterium]|nr:RNA polymerase sigma factor [Crocinitomicaceae bacterium]MDC0100532.1 RNA polymerase sigma factor [Crocinitomicaceae bacterium]MDC1282665.1 RNA polymerase sigma factor [Crocinitomicaceae bacterium]
MLKESRLTNEINVENKEHLKELISGCVKNDRRSQEELFKLFYGKMLGVCMRYARDRDTAEEMLQEGFIKIFDKLEAFDYKGSFEGWIRRIVSNTAIDNIRKSKKNPLLTDNDEDFKLGGSDPIVENEEIQFLGRKAGIALEAVQNLSPAYRAVFNLHVMEEYTHKEIAEILGISEGTSKSNLSKAKMNLQRTLKEKFEKIED